MSASDCCLFLLSIAVFLRDTVLQYVSLFPSIICLSLCLNYMPNAPGANTSLSVSKASLTQSHGPQKSGHEIFMSQVPPFICLATIALTKDL